MRSHREYAAVTPATAASATPSCARSGYNVGRVASESSGFVGLKRLLLGKPIPSHLAHHERLSRITGLAVLSSDALSSVAYATDFILTTLVVAGIGAFY